MSVFAKISSGTLAACLATFAFAANDVVPPAQVVIENLSVAESVSGAAGDAEAGKLVFANRKLGNCLACHANEDLANELFHGEVGPSLDGVASRWTAEQLRAIVVARPF